MTHVMDLSELPRTEVLEVDRLCESFEQAWSQAAAGSVPADPPRLEDWLQQAPAALQPLVLRELLLIELVMLQKRRATVQSEDYVRRFPEHSEIVASALEECRGAVDTQGTQSAPPVAAATGASGQFGNYVLLSKLGQGGMGVVYKARDKQLNRVVALKLLLRGSHASREEIERFRMEAQAAAHLDHPHIVPIYEVGVQDGKHFVALKYIPGSCLSARLRERPLELREAAGMLRSIAEAVHYAHTKGIVHRDLKPANILLTAAGEPCVTDFGLAKRVENDSGLTVSGQLLGTPSYMPPEQAGGRFAEVDAVSDVYSLGGILYCMLTGRPPFQAANIVETISQVLEKEPARPRALNPAVDQDLETVCLKCLEKEKGKRYPSAAALATELTRYLNGEPIQARPIGKFETARRWVRRNPLLTAIYALAGLAAVLLIAVAIINVRLRATQQVARLHEYYATENGIRNRLVDRTVGWSHGVEAELQKAAGLLTADIPPEPLRTLSADVLAGYDLQQLGNDQTIPIPSNDDIELAISADGRMLAWVRRSSAATVEVNLFDLNSLQPIGALQRSVIHEIDRNRVRSLAFSPDSRWLAAGMSNGQVWLWNEFRQGAAPFQEQTAYTKSAASQVAFATDSQSLLVSGVPDVPPETVAEPAATSGSKPKRPKTKPKEFQALRRYRLEGTWVLESQISAQCEHFAVSPDGRWIAVSGEDRVDGQGDKTRDTIALRSVQTRAAYPNWPTIRGREVHFSPDGQLLAVTQYDRRGIELYAVPSGERVRRLGPEFTEAELQVGYQLSFAPQANLLVSSCNDSRLRFWDLGSERMLLSVPAPGRDVPAYQVSPSGNRVAVATSGCLRIFAPRARPVLRTVAATTHVIDDAAFSADGSELFTIGENYGNGKSSATHLQSWSTETGELLNAVHFRVRPGNPVSLLARHPGRLALLSDDRLLVSSSFANGIYQSPPASRALEQLTFVPPGGRVLQDAEFRDGKSGAALQPATDPQASDQRAIRLRPGERAAVPLAPEMLAAIEPGQLLFARVRVEAAPTSEPVFEFWHSLDEKRGSVKEVQGYHVREGYQYYMIDHERRYPADKCPKQSVTLEALKNPALRAVWIDSLCVLPLREAQTSEAPDSLNRLPGYRSMFSSAVDSRVWAIEDDERVVSWNAKSWQEVTRYDHRPVKTFLGDWILNDLVEVDGRLIAGCRDGKLLLIDPRTGSANPNAAIAGPGGAIRTLAADTQRQQFALGTIRGSIEVRDAASQRVIASLTGHTDSVESLTFAADGQWLISGALDRTIRLWRRRERGFEPLLTLRTPGPVQRVRLDDNQRYLAAVIVGENALRLWNLDELRSQFAQLNPLLAWED